MNNTTLHLLPDPMLPQMHFGDSAPVNPLETKTYHRVSTFVSRYGLLIVTLFVLAAVVTVAHASGGSADSGDDVFKGTLDMLVGWIQGTLGKLLAITAFIIGMSIGVIKQSVMAIVIGLVFAIVLFYGPDAILAVFGAAVVGAPV